MIKAKIQITLPLLLLLVMFTAALVTPSVSADEIKAKEAFNAGVEYKNNGDEMGAVASFKMAIKENPNYTDAYINLGTIYFGQKAYDNALEQFKLATEKDPKSVDAFSNLGKVQYVLRRYAEAEVSFKSAIAIQPTADLYKDLGKVYYKKKNYSEVIDAFGKCHEMNGGDYTTYYMVGKSQQKLGNDTKAIEALKQSIKAENNYLSHSLIGQIYLSQEKYGPAASSFKSALKVDPKQYRAAYNYAVAVETSNPENYAENIKNWEAFIKVAKNNPKAKKDVNIAQSHVDDLKDAMEKSNLQ